jgi:hypothetical protein
VDELVRPGDLEAGDVVALPGEAGRFRVLAIRLGQGGFILTVASAEGSRSGAERQITLTADTQLLKYGRIRVY